MSNSDSFGVPGSSGGGTLVDDQFKRSFMFQPEAIEGVAESQPSLQKTWPAKEDDQQQEGKASGAASAKPSLSINLDPARPGQQVVQHTRTPSQRHSQKQPTQRKN